MEKEKRRTMEIVLKDEAYAIIGACFEVYNEKGCGFLEAVYQECLELELELRGIPFRSHDELLLTYKGRVLKKTYQPEFVCFDKIIVEIKAVSELNDEHRAQVHNYLKATGFRLGLLVNFGSSGELKYERIVR
jgi:GxxExxY protein